jgi:integrase
MTKCPRGRPKGSGGGAVAVLTPEDIRQVLRAARDSGRYSGRAEIALRLSIQLGLRAGELVTLKTRDLVDNRGHLRRELSFNSRGLARKLPLSSPELRRALADFCERHLNPHAPDDSVFASQRKGALTRASLARLLTSVYKRTGICGGSSRSGRRTSALSSEFFKTGGRS